MSRVMGQLPLIVMLLSVFVTVAFLFRKGAAYNSVMIIAPFLFEVILGICMAIPGLKDFSFLSKVIRYEVSTVMFNIGSGIDFMGSYYRNILIACVAITVLTFLIGYSSFKKREL